MEWLLRRKQNNDILRVMHDGRNPLIAMLFLGGWGNVTLPFGAGYRQIVRGVNVNLPIGAGYRQIVGGVNATLPFGGDCTHILLKRYFASPCMTKKETEANYD